MASSRHQEREAIEAAERTGMDPAVLASGASVLLSWYYFYLRGDRQQGLFVGLWPPTILAFASYFNQTRMSDKLDRATGRGGVADRVEEMLQRR